MVRYTGNYKFFVFLGVRERKSFTEIITLDPSIGKLLVVKSNIPGERINTAIMEAVWCEPDL